MFCSAENVQCYNKWGRWDVVLHCSFTSTLRQKTQKCFYLRISLTAAQITAAVKTPDSVAGAGKVCPSPLWLWNFILLFPKQHLRMWTWMADTRNKIKCTHFKNVFQSSFLRSLKLQWDSRLVVVQPHCRLDNRLGMKTFRLQNKMVSKRAPWEMDENESFLRKARCMKSLQVPFLCAAKLISIVMNMSVCLACFHGALVGIRQMREFRPIWIQETVLDCKADWSKIENNCRMLLDYGGRENRATGNIKSYKTESEE